MARNPRARLCRQLVAADKLLVQNVDRLVGEAAAKAAGHLSCRVGCIHCCIGLFDITPLDAARLLRGMDRLQRESGALAQGMRRRASEQWEAMKLSFQGDTETGVLSDDEAAREAFFTAFERFVCPVLDPVTGRCLLYGSRPLSCRTFGLPIRSGEESLPPCVLNFTGASPEELEEATIDPDAEDREGELLMRFDAFAPGRGDTVLACVLAEGCG